VDTLLVPAQLAVGLEAVVAAVLGAALALLRPEGLELAGKVLLADLARKAPIMALAAGVAPVLSAQMERLRWAEAVALEQRLQSLVRLLLMLAAAAAEVILLPKPVVEQAVGARDQILLWRELLEPQTRVEAAAAARTVERMLMDMQAAQALSSYPCQQPSTQAPQPAPPP
jgi:hypothetical protein